MFYVTVGATHQTLLAPFSSIWSVSKYLFQFFLMFVYIFEMFVYAFEMLEPEEI